MTKSEFLRELENALTGRLIKSEMEQIIFDYRDVFENGLSEGKTEEEISSEIGSPAAIARTILSESTQNQQAGNCNGASQVDVSNLASMSKRMGAHVIDSLTCGLLVVLIVFTTAFGFYGTTMVGATTMPQDPFAVAENKLTERTTYDSNGSVSKVEIFEGDKRIFKGSYDKYQQFILDDGIDQSQIVSFETVHNEGFGKFDIAMMVSFVPIMMVMMVLGFSNILTALQLWIFKGYTLGKWLLKIKVVRLDDSKVSFWDALLREGIIKAFANGLTSGILNLVSFVWGCATPDHKTVQDLAARTKVINVAR